MIDCCELLIAEHRRTEELAQRLETLLNRATSPQADNEATWLAVRKAYQALAQDLHRHFVLEEQALFSVLHPYRTMILMEVEHDDLLTLQGDFASQLARLSDGEEVSNDEADALLKAFDAFKERLFNHIREEERGIFPLANEKLEEEEKMKVVRLYTELLEASESGPLSMVRPAPGFQIQSTELFASSDKPMTYHTLYDREHTSLQHIRIQAGQKQSPHWAGQHQHVIVLSCQVVFETPQESHTLVSGDAITIDSRLVFAFTAVKDTQLLLFKTWPHPHYSKT
ncbi:MAG: Hemerythrin cation binding domain [Vampirovibrio sp.]|jgi:hemerythrin-like domain-containing protein/quercetin dioxygenase-like cupin family protein|nr:Hemerythrin cation binding domain [Vampirovibrio sp.]